MTALPSSTRICLVTAADAGYFEFARDAIESVLDCRIDGLEIGFMDLGLEPSHREWLLGRDVRIVAPRTLLVLGEPKPSLRQMGYLARPFLRENFPGYDVYVWLDADAWIQNKAGLHALIDGAVRVGAAMVRQNERAYRFWAWQVGWMHKHFVLGYGLLRGVWLANRPMINNGVFALRKDAPHWEHWFRRYQGALARTNLPAPHDQFALNAAVYLDKPPTLFLPATENWICDLATPLWDDDANAFCVPYPPHKPISVLHLAGAAKTNVFEIRRTRGGTLRRSLRRSA